MLLDEVLAAVTVEADPFSLCEMAPQGWLDMPRNARASLHYVLAGEGALHLGPRRSHPVSAGDLILVPAGFSHSLGASDRNFVSFASCQPAALGLAHHRSGNGRGLQVLCADVSVGLAGAGQVIDLLRAPIVEPLCDRHLIGLILAELAGPGPGSRAQVKALLLYLIVAALRRGVARRDPGTDWLVALADRQLWPALAEVLANPGGRHSVESLALRVGMSRARFAARFRQSFGTGPMQLVRELRLQHAARLLLDGNAGVARIAETVGFASRSHFSQAFEARYGVSPGRYGRRAEPTENARSKAADAPAVAGAGAAP